jgi:glycosyltransferase involved in cell wall biosynthesis
MLQLHKPLRSCGEERTVGKCEAGLMGQARTVDAAGTADRSCVFVTTLDLSLCCGPTDHVAGIAGGLAERGYEVTILSPKPQGIIAGAFPDSVRFIHYPSVRILGLPGAFGGFLALVKLWKLRHVNSAYVRCSPGTLPITWFARVLRFRSVVVEHNAWLSDDITSFGYVRGLKLFATLFQVCEANLATANRVVTLRLLELLARRGVARPKLIVIGNGTDTRTFYPLDREECRRRVGIPESNKVVLAFVGNLWPGAGLDTVLRAMKLLKDRGRDVQLIVAGDGIYRNELEITAINLKQASSVRFLGYISAADANIVLGAADVALAPYLRERNAVVGISPLKLYAYAAAGRPCVISSLPGTEELASEPWIFQAAPDSPESLTEAIERALASNRATTSASARAFAEQNDWSRVADRVSQLLFAGCPRPASQDPRRVVADGPPLSAR